MPSPLVSIEVLAGAQAPANFYLASGTGGWSRPRPTEIARLVHPVDRTSIFKVRSLWAPFRGDT